MFTSYIKKLFVLLVLTVLFAVMYFYNVHQIKILEEKEEAHRVFISNAKSNAYKDMNLGAKSILVFDITKNESLFEFHPTSIRPLASITKVMTAIVASDILDPRETVTITKDAIQEEGENNLALNEVWNSYDLIQFMLVVSSNDAAVAIAHTSEVALKNRNNVSETFIDTMNRVAHEIGMMQSVFYNENGLDIDETHAGAIGTASDVVKMVSFAYMHNPNLFIPTTQAESMFTSVSGYIHTIKNTNTIVDTLPGIVLSKTGFTDLAGGNLAIVVIINKKPYALVVLGSTEIGRFNDMEILYNKTKKLVESGILENAGRRD